MRLKLPVVLAIALATAGCVTTDAAPAGDQISYETGRCFGACPVYKVTVNANGEGLFEGIRFTAVQGQQDFRISPEQYRAFAARLAPLRPASGSVRYDAPPLCKRMATDMPSVEVRWRDAAAGERSFYYYFGCDMETNRALAERLKAAPELLPIRSFIRSAPAQ